MKTIILSVLLVSTSFLTHQLNAALALAVASNGKWAIAHDSGYDPKGVAAQAIEKCKARGGADARIAYATGIRAAHGAVAVSDNGAGKIVGFTFTAGEHHLVDVNGNAEKDDERAAIKDCQKKGGQNPKIAFSW